MTTPKSIEQKIREIVCEVTDLTPDVLVPTATFEELEVDSLDLVTILYDIDEELGIDLEASEFEHVKTIQDFIDKVQELAGDK